MSGPGLQVLPILPPDPSAGTLVGKITLFLRFPRDLSMLTDIEDPKIVVGMLRQVADAMDRATSLPPGRVVFEGNEAIPAAALGRR